MKRRKKNAKKRVIFAFLLLLVALPSFSQIVKVTGTVKDEDGEPLIGVSVTLKGTTNGTLTDLDGGYSLSNVEIGSVLTFTYIGYHSTDINITAAKHYDVRLREDTKILDEVIVVAYGVQKKANLTGAVTALKIDDVKDIPVSNTSALLQGRMSGVTVSSFSAQPGKDDDIEIKVRGIGTFGNSNPMVIIDGVEGRLADVSPGDIDNISVLKDAASAAIYGVRAANGVILVTTKRGNEGKQSLSYSASYGVQQATVLPDYLSSSNWATLYNEQNIAEGNTDNNFTPEMIQTLKDGSNRELFANTNWIKELYRSAAIQNHHLSMTGAGTSSKYTASLGHVRQDGIMKGTSSNRTNIRLNADTKYFNKFTIGMNLSGSYQKIDEPYSGVYNIVENLRWHTRPTVPVKYNNGDWGFADGSKLAASGNPVYAALKGYNYTDVYRFDGKIFADLELIKNLHVRTSFAYGYDTWQGNKFLPTDQPKRADGTPIGKGTLENKADQSTWKGIQWINENIVTYNLALQSHTFDFLVGNAVQENKENYFNANISNLPNNNIHQLDAGTTNPSVGGNASEVALVSWFGRVNYNFSDKYLFEANLRIDQSSRIAPKHRTGYFPSFSGGWNIANESFIKEVEALSLLKLRASWGQLGNQEIGNYAFRQGISPGYNYIWGDTKVPGTAIAGLANPDIKWETTTMTDIGLDGSLLNNKITFTADYYIKKTKDILLQIPIPGAMGNVTAPYVNAATVRNKGWELELGYNNRWDAFNFSAKFNLSKVKNEIVYVNDMEWISNGIINKKGYAINTYYGYVADGLYRTQDEIDAVKNNVGKPEIGDVKLVDVSGPDGVPDGVIDATYDRVPLGNPFPKLTYGFNINMGYKGVDFSAFFQGVDGIKRIIRDYPDLAGNAPKIMMNRYHETENPNGTYPRLGNPDYNSQISSYWMKDVSYLRLKNLEIGYSFPARWISKAKLQRLRVYISAQNILTFTSLKDYDPEKVSGDDRNYAYPNAKVFSVGLNISL